jgi:hypothetical protein
MNQKYKKALLKIANGDCIPQCRVYNEPCNCAQYIAKKALEVEQQEQPYGVMSLRTIQSPFNLTSFTEPYYVRDC